MYETEAPDYAAQLAKCAGLNQQAGHSKAMLEVQDWAKRYEAALKQVGLFESLMRLTVP